ncbi:MFS transporter [Hymenobacter sp. BT175]|uniref:MFS transporter n=1 Tax=Hymenobacter translucens TaxID=2886507 RepID=UPI001D0ECAD9|nr:MFS transporter [Hymenobacter translucens]MCC2548581.1 MFS transporter [Hymenobacter translucens]
MPAARSATPATIPAHAPTSPPMAPNRWGLLGVSLVMFMAGLDSNIVNVALPALARELHQPFAAVQWVVLSYLLVTTAIAAAVGRLGDQLGKKRVYLAGTLVFTFGSLLCGLSPSLGALVAARAVQGLGGAVCLALSFAVGGELVPKEQMGRTIGWLGTVASVGMTAGPTLGGLLLTWLGWQWMFLVNVPLGVLAYGLLRRSLPGPDAPQDLTQDWAGMGLMALWVTCYTLGLTWIESAGFWNPLVLGLLGAAAIGAAGFVAYEQRVAYPFLNPRVLRHGPLSASLLASLLVQGVMIATTIVLTYFLTGAAHYSPARIGLLLSVGPLTTVLLSPVAGYLSDRFGAARVMLAGTGLMVLAGLSLAFLQPETSDRLLALRLVLLSLGYTLFRTPNNAQVITLAPLAERGLVSGLLMKTRTLGQITGAALVGSVFARLLSEAGFADVSQASVPALVSSTQGAFWLIASLALAAAALVYASVRSSSPVFS